MGNKETVVVSRQSEFNDAVDRDVNIEIRNAWESIDVGGREVAVFDNSLVTARTGAIVRSFNQSKVDAYGGMVIARDSSKVYAHKDTVVHAYDKAEIFAHHQTKVDAHNTSAIDSYDESIIFAYDQSVVHAHDDSRVHLFGHSVGHVYDRAVVFGTEYANIYTHSPDAKVTIEGMNVSQVVDINQQYDAEYSKSLRR